MDYSTELLRKELYNQKHWRDFYKRYIEQMSANTDVRSYRKKLRSTEIKISDLQRALEFLKCSNLAEGNSA